MRKHNNTHKSVWNKLNPLFQEDTRLSLNGTNIIIIILYYIIL